MSSSPSHGGEGEPSSSTTRGRGGNDGNNNNGSRRRRRRRRPPTPPPPLPSHEAEPSTSYNTILPFNNNNGVWPEPFVENLSLQVGVNASISLGRLAVAPALAIFFQVCVAWRAVSQSEFLWQNLVRLVWNRTNLVHNSWREEFIFCHRGARNFRTCHYSYAFLHPSDHQHPVAPGEEEGGGGDQLPLFCLRLAIANDHLAAGFSDGSVRLFHLPTRVQLRTIQPHLRDRLGLFSRAVSGIVLLPTIDRLVFASLDGDIHVTSPLLGQNLARRAFLGDIVNDGALVDFAGCGRYWVGLYAGVPGRALRMWHADTEELLFIGGSLTDPESVMGWHMLTELQPAELVGRVRVAAHGLALGFTSLRVLVLDLEAHAVVVREEAARRGIIVGSVDTNGDAFVMVDTRGVPSVRSTRTLREICRLDRAPLRGVSLRGLLGCMNSMYVFMSTEGIVRVWDAQRGEYLYSLRERIGDATAFFVNDRFVAACCGDTRIHLWDFGA